MSPEIVTDLHAMQARADELVGEGRTICLVPTMGFLHEGHLSLLREGRRRADVLVLSIFVNPTQFAPGEDYERYPRDEQGDVEKAAACGTDIVFVPDVPSMYARDYQTGVIVRDAQQGLCGTNRPTHFIGVATVVTKLFHIVRPHVAVFGQKDYQQLALIRAMVRDLDFGIKIIGVPIVREPDGLAMSSRNAYLSDAERQQALALSCALSIAEEVVTGGETDPGAVVSLARQLIDEAPLARIDYVEVRDAQTLATVDRIEQDVVLAVAATFGKTRLIDNRVLTVT